MRITTCKNSLAASKLYEFKVVLTFLKFSSPSDILRTYNATIIEKLTDHISSLKQYRGHPHYSSPVVGYIQD